MSSTFEDLKEERDKLQQEVFPSLKEFCLAHGARFQVIDLRWGVSEEASLDQQAMNICLTEIERCRETSPRPNFLVLLGDRYGWCPPPPELPADVLEWILARVPLEEDRLLVESWYLRDDNAVPAVRYLRPRDGEFESYEVWGPVERRLRSIIVKAVEGSELANDPRFVASATEQEIVRGVLRIPDAQEHVFCFFRSIEGLPAEASAHAYRDLNDDGSPDGGAEAQLDRLKGRLRASLHGNAFEYAARWTGERPTADHLDRLAADVKDVLLRVISDELARLGEVDELEQELGRHWEFAGERSSDFTGRAEILARIGDYVSGSDPRPLAVYGDSGSGKSALIARAAQDARRNHDVAVVVALRFIGTTLRSTDGQRLLGDLSRQITRRYAEDPSLVEPEKRELLDESSVPSDFEELAEIFHSVLGSRRRSVR